MTDKEFNPLEHSIVMSLMRNEPYQTYEATDFHEALLFAIAREIGRVHHNHYQSSWDRWSDDPHIPGIRWRRYVYQCDCPESDDGFIPRHLENCIVSQPNFQFEDVEFNWYKYPGRGMSVNKEWATDEWRQWFDRCITKIREFDTIIAGGSKSLEPLPDASNFYIAACEILSKHAVEEDLPKQLAVLRESAHKGQREIGSEDKSFWEYVEGDPLSDRDARMIALGVVAERDRAQRSHSR